MQLIKTKNHLNSTTHYCVIVQYVLETDSFN